MMGHHEMRWAKEKNETKRRSNSFASTKFKFKAIFSAIQAGRRPVSEAQV